MGDSILSISARLARLGLPIALGRSGAVTMGLVDTIVVGQLAPRQLADLALGWTGCGPALIGGIGLLLGVQVLTARLVGEGRPQATGAVWRRGLVIAGAAGLAVWVAVALGHERLLLTLGIAPGLAAHGAAVARVLALSIPFHLAFLASSNFLEGLQRPTPPALFMWLANGVNLALNLALVPAHGAAGSAWATVLSRLFLALTAAGFILAAPALAAHRKRGAAAPGYGALLRIGLAAAVSGAVEAGAFASMGVIAARLGAVAIATFNLSTNPIIVVFLIAQGLGTGATVLVAQAMGSGASTDSARIGWIAIVLNALAMAVLGVLAVIFAEPIARALTADPVLIASLVGVMGLVALLMTPDAGQGVTEAVLRARGDWYPTAARLACFVGLSPALGFIFTQRLGFGVAGVVGALCIASFAAYGALLARLAWLTLRGPALTPASA